MSRCPCATSTRASRFYARYARMQVVHRREGVVWLSDRTRPFVIVLMEGGEVEHPLRPAAHLGVGVREPRGGRPPVRARARARRASSADRRTTARPSATGPSSRDPDGHTLEISYGQDVGLTVERA